MSDIDQIKLRRLDGTVLLVFLGLLRARKATEVAAELGLTQSTISHALKRLREVFGDELFLRRPHGLEPTSVARALEPQVRTAVESLRLALAGPPVFDPSTSDAILRIGASDQVLATLAPKLLAELRALAPMMRCSAQAVGRSETLSALAQGGIDLAIGYFWTLPPDFLSETLYTETYLVAGPTSHAYFSGRPSLKRFVTADHVVTSPAGELSGIVDRALAEQGLTRRVVASAPLFFPALAMARATGALLTAPSRFVRTYAPLFKMAVAAPPLKIRPFEVSVVRHRRDAHDGLKSWASNLIKCAASDARR